MNDYYLKTQGLAVGYGKKIIISDISINVEKGKILTLIGPNGSGKSTILKSITRQLSMISGVVYINSENLMKISNRDISTKMSVVLTERIRPDMMTCFDVVASGRYPYTNHFGRLTDHDMDMVYDSLDKVNVSEIAMCEFSEISDGQRQRVMLARAICQEPEIIVLDEPTSFLDIKHKIELLDILRKMSVEKGITIIMSLHEIDLAPKISDKVMCVRENELVRCGTPEEIFSEDMIKDLYHISKGSYNMIFGSVELSKPMGKPKAFIIAGNGYGTPIYRQFQKKGIPFSTGILFENDVDYQVASALASEVISQQAFLPISKELVERAKVELKKTRIIIDAGTPIGEFNRENMKLIEEAREKNIQIYTNIEEALEFLYEE